MGTAIEQGFEFHPVAAPEEFLSLAGQTPSIIIVHTQTLTDSILTVTRSVTQDRNTWIIHVVDDLSEGDIIRAALAGSLGAISLREAMHALPHIIRTLFKNSDSFQADIPDTLHLCDGVALKTTEHVLSSGKSRIQLAPIPGRLLECLAIHRGHPVMHADLKQYGWGISSGVSDHALYQQMSRLREIAVEAGIEKRLRALRGRGYILE